MEKVPDKMDRYSCRRNLQIRLKQIGIPYDSDGNINYLIIQEVSYIFENGTNYLQILQKCTFPEDFQEIRRDFYRNLTFECYTDLRRTVARIRIDFIHIQNTIWQTCYYTPDIILIGQDIRERTDLVDQLSTGMIRGPVNRFISHLYRELVRKTLACAECQKSFQTCDPIQVVGLDIFHEDCCEDGKSQIPVLNDLTKWILQIHPELRDVIERKPYLQQH